MISVCRNLNAVLVCGIADKSLYHGYNGVSLAQSVRDPPHKGRLVVDIACLGKLGKLDSVQFFHIY